MISLTEFLREGFHAQQKYAEKAGGKGPLDDLTDKERYAKVIEHLGHMIEEVVEARMLVPRRSWKNYEPGYLDNYLAKREFAYEMVDILLFFRAAMAYSGLTTNEFEDFFNEKMDYNNIRKDHNVNV